MLAPLATFLVQSQVFSVFELVKCAWGDWKLCFFMGLSQMRTDPQTPHPVQYWPARSTICSSSHREIDEFLLPKCSSNRINPRPEVDDPPADTQLQVRTQLLHSFSEFQSVGIDTGYTTSRIPLRTWSLLLLPLMFRNELDTLDVSTILQTKSYLQHGNKFCSSMPLKVYTLIVT